MDGASPLSLLSLAAGIADEVGHSAGVVRANLHYLSEAEGEDLSEEGRAALRDAISSMWRIDSVVRQLLEVGRLAVHAEERESVALRDAAEEAAGVARSRCGARVAIVSRVPPGLRVDGRGGLVARVLADLVIDAARPEPEGRGARRVVIEGELRSGCVEVAVEDDGAGLEPDVLRRVFEPFFARKPFESTIGLRLAVSRGLLAGVGGELRLVSGARGGTRVVVELEPAVAPEIGAARATSSAAADGTAGEAKGRPRLFLVGGRGEARSPASSRDG